MSTLKIVILATMFACAGFDLSQTATAAQFPVSTITTETHPRSAVINSRYLALAKKCTLRRYRRPH